MSDPLEQLERELLAKICSQCHVACYKPHPQWPHKYFKCDLCGFTLTCEDYYKLCGGSNSPVDSDGVPVRSIVQVPSSKD